jgi:hypothetical protein
MNKCKYIANILAILLLLSSCGPSSIEDLRWEARKETLKLASELRAIETREELQKALPRLKKRFNALADLVVDARRFPTEEKEPTEASEELFAQLARLYEMPGGRELIETAQMDAIRRIKR